MTTPILYFSNCCSNSLPQLDHEAPDCVGGNRNGLIAMGTDTLISITALVAGILCLLSKIRAPLPVGVGLVCTSGLITVLWVAMVVKIVINAVYQQRDPFNLGDFGQVSRR